MMLNKLPSNATMKQILSYLEGATKFGARNRALFVMRQHLRIKDLSEIKISDVLNKDKTVSRYYVSADGIRFVFPQEVQIEIFRFLANRFKLCEDSLEELDDANLNLPMFFTQKKSQFSSNTLAQNLSSLDKLVRLKFASKQKNILSW